MAETLIRVCVVFSPAPRRLQRVELSLVQGSTVDDALRACGLLQGLPAGGADALQASVWGRKQRSDHVLRDRDRVELCRALTVDPKVARRERFARQGAGTTGLFARRRAGAKAGY